MKKILAVCFAAAAMMAPSGFAQDKMASPDKMDKMDKMDSKAAKKSKKKKAKMDKKDGAMKDDAKKMDKM
jgi:hypothetical protein